MRSSNGGRSGMPRSRRFLSHRLYSTRLAGPTQSGASSGFSVQHTSFACMLPQMGQRSCDAAASCTGAALDDVGGGEAET